MFYRVLQIQEFHQLSYLSEKHSISIRLNSTIRLCSAFFRPNSMAICNRASGERNSWEISCNKSFFGIDKCF